MLAVGRAISWFANGVRKNAPAGLIDGVICSGAYLLALALRTGLRFDTIEVRNALFLCGLAGVAQVFANIVADIYWRTWRYVSLRDALALLNASIAAAVVVLAADLLMPGTERNLPLSTIPIGALLTAGFLLLYRLRDRAPEVLRAAARGKKPDNVIIVGADQLGGILAGDLDDPLGSYRVRAFIDEDPARVGTYIHGHRVEGTVADLGDLVRRFEIDVVAIASREASGPVVRRIVEACDRLDVQVRKISRPSDALNGRPRLEQIQLEDLLRRDVVRHDEERCRALLGGKSVLITGAAGSIGSELARQALRYSPSSLVLLDIDESRLFDLSLELASPAVTIRLCDVRDRAAVERVFRAYSIDLVFHAAALKHAPLLETHVSEAIDTNVLGTLNIAEAAIGTGSSRFVFISTDKAVEPEGVMGATKRLGELLVRSLAPESDTVCAVVRFGNVLGSRGSVIPIFMTQIDAGGPVTVTDARCTRYFMSIAEAVALVIEAAALAENGDVFMLEMGDPIPILELARRLIRLRGLRVGRDVDIVFTGLRPGEKLDEQLRFDFEKPRPTAHDRVQRLVDDLRPWNQKTLADILTDLRSYVRSVDDESSRRGIFEMVAQRETEEPGLVANPGK
jgi:FlaA1/EpsC-like NDP-sugar epimerase